MCLLSEDPSQVSFEIRAMIHVVQSGGWHTEVQVLVCLSDAAVSCS